MINPRASRRGLSRRSFLAAAAAVASPLVIPASALGKAGRPAPSERIVMGCVGVGGMGTGNMHSFLGNNDTQIIMVCDIYKPHLQGAVSTINNHYRNQDCVGTPEFMDVVTNPKIDALSIALPDHWHAIPAVIGARHGKDIYGEKPLAHSIVEGRAICNAIRQYGRIWQTGSWQRSQGNFRAGAELVLNGYIGKLQRVEVGLPSGGGDDNRMLKPENPPEGFDWDRWLGPAPWAPYSQGIVHFDWRWNLDYGGGQLTDWIGHHCDIAHWGMGIDTFGGPLEVEGVGEYRKKGLYNSASRYRITCKYPDDVTMIIAGGHNDIRGGTKWIGTDGWVWVDRGGFDAHPKDLLKLADAPKKINLLRSPGHQREFLDCVRSRRLTITDCEIAQRSMTPGYLGQIAMLLGRKIKWDAKTERILGDEAATRMLGRAYREPWQL